MVKTVFSAPAPVNLTLYGVNTTSIRVTWWIESQVDSFYIQYKPCINSCKGQQLVTNASQSEYTHYIKGLEPGQQYEVFVKGIKNKTESRTVSKRLRLRKYE